MRTRITGEVGPFLDRVQQRQVSVVVVANCTFASMGVPGGQAQIEQQVQFQMLRAFQAVLGPKMASGQLTFKDLGTGNARSLLPEIIATSGLAHAGVAVDVKAMGFGIDGRPPYPAVPDDLAAQAPAPAPAPTQQAPMGGLVPGGISFDASGLGANIANRVKSDIKSAVKWWLFFGAAVVLVLVVLGGYGFYVYKTSTPNVVPPPMPPVNALPTPNTAPSPTAAPPPVPAPAHPVPHPGKH